VRSLKHSLDPTYPLIEVTSYPKGERGGVPKKTFQTGHSAEGRKAWRIMRGGARGTTYTKDKLQSACYGFSPEPDAGENGRNRDLEAGSCPGGRKMYPIYKPDMFLLGHYKLNRAVGGGGGPEYTTRDMKPAGVFGRGKK